MEKTFNAAFESLMNSWDSIAKESQKTKFKTERYAYKNNRSLSLTKKIQMLEAFGYDIEIIRPMNAPIAKNGFENERDTLTRIFYDWGRYKQDMSNKDLEAQKEWLRTSEFDHMTTFHQNKIIYKAGYRWRLIKK